MPDWDTDSDRLTANLNALIERLAAHASEREAPTIAEVQAWHPGNDYLKAHTDIK